MRHGRRDANHAKIRDGLRAVVGKENVIDTADVGGGFPDLVVGRAGQTFLLEVKAEKGKLTPEQERVRTIWRGHWVVVRSLSDALHAIGIDAILAGAK